MDPTPSQQEVLSQSDVERLLAQLSEQDSSTVVHKAGGEVGRKSQESIQPFDFRQPAFLSASELRKLRLQHEDFIKSLSARLSIYLRLEFSLQMSKLHTLAYQKFVDGLTNPTQVTLFKIEPLRGVCLLDMPPRLALTIVDRLLGGPAHSVTLGRDLSEIEMSLLDQAVQVILGEWSNHWARVMELRPVILGHETNGRFLQTSTKDTVVLAMAMEARFGDCLEQIQLGLPFYTLEPLVRKLNASLDASDQEMAAAARVPAQWDSRFDEVNVPITAEWVDQEISMRELATLQAGDVLLLSEHCVNNVQVRLARMRKFSGRLGTRGKSWAVELTGVNKS